MPHVGVFATVFDSNGRVVCVKQNYPPYYWTTPGGKLESHESPTLGIAREIFEETGFRVEIRGLVGVYAAPFKDDIVLGFAAAISGREAWIPNDEIAAVELFSPSALPTPMKKNTAQRIIDASQKLRGVYRVFESAETHGSLYSNELIQSSPTRITRAIALLAALRKSLRSGRFGLR